MTVPLVDERMSDVDALVWAVEREPRLRTTIAALARFEGSLDARMLRHRVERASRVIPRLRQRVVHNPLAIAAPLWSIDPDFRLSFHLRRLQLSNADDGRLLQVVRDLIVQPFDRSRPLWEFTVIEGCADGGSALLLKSHHSVSDGVGGVEMMLELFDLQPDAAPDSHLLPPAPQREDEPVRRVDEIVREEALRLLDTARRSLTAVAGPRSFDEMVDAARFLGESLGSALRMYRPVSPGARIPTARSAGLDVRHLTVPLADLRAAGARIGGTINDAFVAAVALGATDHHRGAGADDPLHISIPISTRADGDGAGNHWTPGRIELRIPADLGPDEAADRVRVSMKRLRDEPAHGLLAPLAAGMRCFPQAATASLFASMTSGIDLAVSNVPGSPIPLHLCGSEVVELIPFGPLSGCAANVTLMSHAGAAHIGVATDPAAIPDADGFLRDLRTGITAMVKGS
jgi:diacylglycerol O-acyltransferase / wax synthase